MADEVLLIAACHHKTAIAVTQVLRRHSLQNKQLNIHKPDKYSSKNNLPNVATVSVLAVAQRTSHTK